MTNSKAWIFGYGSLLCPESLARSIERRVELDEYRGARLHGFRKAWGARHRSLNLVSPEWQPVEGGDLSVLYLQRDAEAMSRGGIIELTMSEIENLDGRERHYDRIEVPIEVRDPSGDWVGFEGRVFTYYPRFPAVEQALIDSGEVRTVSRYFNMAAQGIRRLGMEDDTPPIQIVDGFDADMEFGQHWTLRQDAHLLEVRDSIAKRHRLVSEYSDRLAATLHPPGAPGPADCERLGRPVILSRSLLNSLAQIAQRAAAEAGESQGWVDLALWRPFVLMLGVNVGDAPGIHDLLADEQQFIEQLRRDPRHPPFPFQTSRECLATRVDEPISDDDWERLTKREGPFGNDLPLLFTPVMNGGEGVERRNIPWALRASIHEGRCFGVEARAGEDLTQCQSSKALRGPVFTPIDKSL